MTAGGEPLSDYKWKGDTYWIADRHCPECDSSVSSNGSVFMCVECDWWTPVDE